MGACCSLPSKKHVDAANARKEKPAATKAEKEDKGVNKSVPGNSTGGPKEPSKPTGVTVTLAVVHDAVTVKLNPQSASANCVCEQGARKDAAPARVPEGAPGPVRVSLTVTPAGQVAVSLAEASMAAPAGQPGTQGVPGTSAAPFVASARSEKPATTGSLNSSTSATLVVEGMTNAGAGGQPALPPAPEVLTSAEPPRRSLDKGSQGGGDSSASLAETGVGAARIGINTVVVAAVTDASELVAANLVALNLVVGEGGAMSVQLVPFGAHAGALDGGVVGGASTALLSPRSQGLDASEEGTNHFFSSSVALNELLSLESNAACADCGAPEPRWADVSTGVFVCIRCSGAHRSLGTHISKVMSTKLDTWTPDLVIAMAGHGGNKHVNSVLECAVPPDWDARRPSEASGGAEREEWIRAKYERRLFAPEGPYASEHRSLSGPITTVPATLTEEGSETPSSAEPSEKPAGEVPPPPYTPEASGSSFAIAAAMAASTSPLPIRKGSSWLELTPPGSPDMSPHAGAGGPSGSSSPTNRRLSLGTGKRRKWSNSSKSKLAGKGEGPDLQVGMLEYIGLLKVQVVQGRNLAPSDSARSGCYIASIADIYVVVTLGRQVLKTKKIARSYDPKWNEGLMFSIPDTKEALKLSIYSSSRLLGSGEVSLTEIATAVEKQALAGTTSIRGLAASVSPEAAPGAAEDALSSGKSPVQLLPNGEVTQRMWVPVEGFDGGEVEIQIVWIDLRQ
eukprot:jgi/Mesvir1/8633/Mv02582-RA.1